MSELCTLKMIGTINEGTNSVTIESVVCIINYKGIRTHYMVGINL